MADKGAKIEIWNQQNKYGWTPLVVAAGHRLGNFKPSAETIATIRKVMLDAGVTPPTDTLPVSAGGNDDYKAKAEAAKKPEP